MLSIDEAIAHAKAVAETCEYEASKYDMSDSYEREVAYKEGKCAGEHEQLAEWLEELKFLRQWKSDIMDSFCKYDVNSFEELVTNTRNKAIDDFAKWLENKKYLMKEIQEHNFCYTHYDELKANYVVTEYFEEQLKVGGVNE